jgi:hypothetical protein
MMSKTNFISCFLAKGPAVLDDDDILSNASTSTAGIRLLKLWNISMRSLDDVRVTVRESGETLARGVRSLTCKFSVQLLFIESIEGFVSR